MSDIFRPKYRELSAEEKKRVEDIKAKAQELYDLFPMTEDGRGQNRETSLAMTSLEEAIMWVVKGLTK